MRATVVSLLPYPVRSEHKPGLFPAQYDIPAAGSDGVAVLVVNDGTRGVYLDQDRGTEMVVTSGEVIARSLVDDYVLSQPGQDQTAGPGLFWVSGVFTVDEVKKKFGDLVAAARAIQQEWWKKLVRLADDTWQQAHVIAQIGDLDRVACRQLGLKREWLDDSPDAITTCPVCRTVISKLAMKCFACQEIVNVEAYKAFKAEVNAALNPVQSVNSKA